MWQEKEAVRMERSGAEVSLYEGLGELFPEAYSTRGLNITDSGKLMVLADLLGAIRQLGPSDRYAIPPLKRPSRDRIMTEPWLKRSLGVKTGIPAKSTCRVYDCLDQG